MEFYANGHPEARAYGKTMFEGELRGLPYPTEPLNIEAAIEAMYTDGYVIFPGVLNRDEVQQLRERMDAMGSQNEDDYVVPGWCYNKHVGSEFHQNADHLEYIDRPGIIDVAEAILSSRDGGLCHVLFGSSWVTGAGRAMGIHVDYLPVSLPESVHNDPEIRMPIFMATAHFYLNDMVAELGPTLLIPGSHRAGRPPHDETTWNGIEPMATMVKAGDVVLFRSDVWHGAWRNTHETERRYLLQVAYGSGYMKKNYPPIRYTEIYNPAVLEKATERQRRLLDYARAK
ncbi:MAG: hypothetical protein OHK0029_00240 [Armatimonadaceae bacterium]